MNFGTIAFSEAAKKLQEKAGSRTSYARMEKAQQTDAFTDDEKAFIELRDGFYLASIGDNGYPYIQYRGGPMGFLRVLDPKRLAFLDFSGNKQFISQGNITTNPHVSLFLMDYATRTRLKILADAELRDLTDHKELVQKLWLPNYVFKPDRIMILHLKAFDWNCPQHITPRFTLDEIEVAFRSQPA